MGFFRPLDEKDVVSVEFVAEAGQFPVIVILHAI